MINFDDLSLEEQKESTQREIDRMNLVMKLTKESLEKLEKTRRDVDWKIRKNKAREYVKEFIEEHGNVLNKSLHDEIRLRLCNILYKGEIYITTYQMVLHIILDALEIKWEYEKGLKGKDLKLKIEIGEVND